MNARKWGALLPALLAFHSCDMGNVAGTNNETHSKGTLFQSNGQVAVGARIRVFAASKGVDDSLPVAQTTVDANGQVSLQLKAGYYSLLADDTAGHAVFLDSILSNGDSLTFPNDTLRPTGTLSGHLHVQPMHSPAIAWVHVMRTGLFANVDSSGSFQLEGVPEGRMEVVALTHLPEYTPTFREARAISDSTVDIGTIDLVYNGLPLAKEIAARYDSLTGIVTVTWRDTAFARKEGWQVYRGKGGASSADSIGLAGSGTFQDTVFAAYGHSGPYSNLDSIETDLSYWVAARSKDGATGPRWEKVSVHVRSPALRKRWTVEWSAVRPVTGFAQPAYSRLDTLSSGLSVSQWVSTSDTSAVYRIRVLDARGTWSTANLPSIPEMESEPVFWNGRVWLVRGISSSRHFDDTTISGTFVQTDIYDSVAILSSADGLAWDSSAIALPLDSITSFRLNATATELVLVPCYARQNPVVARLSHSRGMLVSGNGSSWSARPKDSVLTGQDGRPFVATPWQARLVPIGPDSTWTLFDEHWIIPGVSVDTDAAIFHSTDRASASGRGDLVAISDGKRLAVANPRSPGSWQRLSIPEPINAIRFWQGKLVALGETGLHFATITPNP